MTRKTTADPLGNYQTEEDLATYQSFCIVRILLTVAVILFACIILPNRSSAQDTSDNWPRILGPDGDSKSRMKDIRLDWEKKPPELAWFVKTGVGYGNCVVAEEKVFHFDRFADQERLTCYSVMEGKELWRSESPVQYEDTYQYNNGPRASPVIGQGVVLTYGVTGNLRCHRIDDGSLIWQKQMNEEFNVRQNFFGVASTPIIHKNDVWVMVGGAKESDAVETPNGSAMVCLNLETGIEQTRCGDYLSSYSSPIIAEFDQKAYLFSLVREGLMAIDLEARCEIDFFPWRADIRESVNAASPVALDNEILISECYGPGSALLEFRDGKLIELWRDSNVRKRKLIRAHWATPIAFGKFIFAGSGRNEPDANIRCIDIESRKVLWQERTHERFTMTAVDDHLVMLGEFGRLILVKQNPVRMEVVGALNVGDLKNRDGTSIGGTPMWAPPVIANGRLFVRSKNHLLCFLLTE